MGKSEISYFKEVGGHVWNPITGCQGIGCAVREPCYAKRIIKARPAIHGIKMGLGGSWSKSEPLAPERVPFNNVQFHPDRLNEPLKRRKPTVYGVGFFGDIGDKQVQKEWVHKILHVTEQRPEHEFVFLTKHPENFVPIIVNHWTSDGSRLKNCWFGVTVNTQADLWRAEELLKVSGKRWLSIEPMWEPIDLHLSTPCDKNCNEFQYAECPGTSGPCIMQRRFDLVVVGGESGKDARPMHPDWVRSIRDQCQAAGVMFNLKQNGEWIPYDMRIGTVHSRNRIYTSRNRTGKRNEVMIADGGQYFERVGLKRAGRTLDGREWTQLPWRKA